jgi:periplasmic glucans biosynthesis protein
MAYRMRWTDQRLPPELLYTAASRAGQTLNGNGRVFVIDFRRSDPSADIDSDGISMDVSASKGTVMNAVIHATEPEGALRASFELDPGSEELSELRLVLVKDGKPASEKWLYRWRDDAPLRAPPGRVARPIA